MGFQIVTLSPLWFLIICALLAGLMTWWLYRRHIFESKLLVRLMRILRFTGLFLLFSLLLAPMVRMVLHREHKPMLLIYRDKSSSAALKSGLAEKEFEQGIGRLAEKFDLHQFDFAGNVVPAGDSLSSKNVTNLSSVFDYTNEVFEGKQTAGILLITDGISNRGLNPLFQKLHKPAPLYTIGIGDTTRYPDAWVASVEANSTVFFQNEFTVETSLRSHNLQAGNINVTLLDNGVPVKTAVWQRSGTGADFTRLEFVVRANAVGLRHLEVRIDPVAGENNPANNAKGIWVNVTDTRKRVAIFSQSAHPDIAAIARALETSVQYSVSRFDQNERTDLSAFDVAIFHGYPGTADGNEYLQQLKAQKKPFWVIFSTQSNENLLNGGQWGFEPTVAGGTNTVLPELNENFSEFMLPDNLASQVRNWPPLEVSYGRFRTGAGFKTMLFQRIGAVSTSMPLLGFTTSGNSRQAWLMGAGIWKWRLRNFQELKSHEVFDAFVSKVIQYLGTGDAGNAFRAFAESPTLLQGESAVILAEYFDKNLEPDNRADADLEITGPSGYRKQFRFARNNRRYRIETGSLPAGEYQFTAKMIGNGNPVASGSFTVTGISPEQENTVADFGLLRKISANTNGSFEPASGFSKMVSNLLSRAGNTTTISEEIKILELIHWKWFFALIVLCFGTEWFLRKREGGY